MRLLTVLGTRPQLIKYAALQSLGGRFVDTGQHWDDNMAGVFYRELGLPRPLSGDLNAILDAERPDAVVVIGDTNSTVAGAQAAVRHGIPVAHIEAGLRSFDTRMPEERNRVMVDHLSTWHFAPTQTAVANLAAEGISGHLVGDLMQDLASATLEGIRDPREFGLRTGRYLYATVHRAENREPEAIAAWTAILNHVSTPERPVILALHPGTHVDRSTFSPNVIIIEPVGYRTSLALQLHAAAVLTDSGGVQREAAWLTTPCLVLRETTEWDGTVLVGLDLGRVIEAMGQASTVRQARERAATVRIPAVGVARAIAAVLDTREELAA